MKLDFFSNEHNLINSRVKLRYINGHLYFIYNKAYFGILKKEFFIKKMKYMIENILN